MNSGTLSRLPQGFLRIHVIPFEQAGFHFVRSPELNFVSRGKTAFDAMVNFVNMAAASITVAAHRGNLPALIQKTRVEIVDMPPPDQESGSDDRHIFLPLIAAADARTRAMG